MGNSCTCSSRKEQTISHVNQNTTTVQNNNQVEHSNNQNHEEQKSSSESQQQIIKYTISEIKISQQKSEIYTKTVKVNQSYQQFQVESSFKINQFQEQEEVYKKNFEHGNIDSSNKSDSKKSENHNYDDFMTVQYLNQQNNQYNLLDNQQATENNNQQNKQFLTTQNHLYSTNIEQ